MDENGDVVLNWVGESIAGWSGVGEEEVGKLDEDPVSGIDATNGTYDGGDCSTYGGPNCHSTGCWVHWAQSLDALCNTACGGSSGCCGGGPGDYSCYAANVTRYYYH